VTSRLGTEKTVTFFYSVPKYAFKRKLCVLNHFKMCTVEAAARKLKIELNFVSSVDSFGLDRCIRRETMKERGVMNVKTTRKHILLGKIKESADWDQNLQNLPAQVYWGKKEKDVVFPFYMRTALKMCHLGYTRRKGT
jgi:hypothetical protein